MPLSQKTSASDEFQLRALRLLEANPQVTQREMAEALGVSLGRTHFCIKAHLEKGSIRLHNFQSNCHKLAHSYLHTLAGNSNKSVIAARIFKRKLAEYKQLRIEIALLQWELIATGTKK